MTYKKPPTPLAKSDIRMRLVHRDFSGLDIMAAHGQLLKKLELYVNDAKVAAAVYDAQTYLKAI